MPAELVNPDGTPWTPVFDRQRPPFQPGNQLAVTHGAYSKQRQDPIARRLLEEVATDPVTAYLSAPRFHAQLWQWAVAQAKVEILAEWVDSMPISEASYSDRGQVSPLELLRRFMATAMTAADKIGLTPTSSARLGKDYAQGKQADAAATLTELRTQHERAEAQRAGGE